MTRRAAVWQAVLGVASVVAAGICGRSLGLLRPDFKGFSQQLAAWIVIYAAATLLFVGISRAARRRFGEWFFVGAAVSILPVGAVFALPFDDGSGFYAFLGLWLALVAGSSRAAVQSRSA